MSNFLVGTNLADVQLDKFNGDTSTVAFTLSVASSTFSALVRISGVVQTPTDDFNIVNSTLTFTTAPPTGTNNIVVTYTKATQIGVPNDASVSASKLASNAVTTDKLQDNSITLNKMAHGLDGNLISFNSVGAPAYVSTGSAAEVLTSNGAGAAPTFQTPAAGGNSWSNSSKGSFTNATEIEFTSLPNVCRILLFFSTAPGTATGFLSKDNGTTYETGNVYMFNRTSQATATATPNVYQDNNATSIFFQDKSEYREIIIAGAATTNVFTCVKSVSFADSNRSLSTIFANYNAGRDVTNAFKVTFSTGSGEYRLDIPTAL